jgi:hypothetical protein
MPRTAHRSLRPTSVLSMDGLRREAQHRVVQRGTL